MILRGLRRANGIKGIVSVSGATQRDVRRLIGESEMIANGVEDFWQPMEPREAASRIAEAGAPAKEYLLHVGGGQWYKNRAGVVRGFIDLRTQTAHAPNLVLVGPPLDARLAAQLRQAALGKDVIVLHGVTDETLRALYSMARVFIFPSLEEGFGWPILEAQACGCPVVTTSREPMTDTGGEAAIYTNEAEWTKGAIEVLEMDDTRRAALVAAGMENARRYSVKKMAAAYIEFYKRHQ
jgi:glycosyltransferase involved in cell wall biosynthesis